uniref:VWFA domain-containing protein n=1 Tax=Ciona savignyi TaxID=51511 RepID=H2ZKN2_CIOSA
FECDVSNQYSLYPSGAANTTTCNGTTWVEPPPCCNRQCPPYAKVDAVVILDSSSSIGRANWRRLVNFVQGVLGGVEIGPHSARIGVFRYNRFVDTQSQILMKDYPNDKAGLLRAIGNIHYNGNGTYTGQALDYAADVMLTPENGNRPGVPDIVF